MGRIEPRLAAMMSLPPALWAGNAVVGRWAVDHCAPLTFNALRWALAALLLLPLGGRALRQREALVACRGYLLGLGLLGAGLFGALQYAALHSTSAVNSTLIAASMPLWMLVVGWLFAGERPAAAQGVGALLSMSGVAVVLARGVPSGLDSLQVATGDLLMLAGVAAFAVYSWMLSRPPASVRRAGLQSWDWSGLLLLQTLFALPIALAAAAVEWVVVPQPLYWSPWLAPALLFVAIGPSIVAYRWWALAVARGGPALAALFANLAPLFAALLSAALLGEQPRWYHGVAGVLILAGVAVASKADATRPRRTTSGQTPVR